MTSNFCTLSAPNNIKSVDESTLVSLLQKQDKEALTHIYQRYRQALMGVIFRIVQDQAVTEDVFQECLVKFWRKGPTYDASKGRLFTWMLNICRNAAIDKTRSKEFKQAGAIQSDLDFVSISQPGQTYELKTDQIGLQEWVDRLEPQQRELIDRVYFMGRSHSEAAKELNLPLGTVKTRIRAALGTLRKWTTS